MKSSVVPVDEVLLNLAERIAKRIGESLPAFVSEAIRARVVEEARAHKIVIGGPTKIPRGLYPADGSTNYKKYRQYRSGPAVETSSSSTPRRGSRTTTSKTPITKKRGRRSID